MRVGRIVLVLSLAAVFALIASSAAHGVSGEGGIHGTVHRADGSPAGDTDQYIYRSSPGGWLSWVGLQPTASDGTFDARVTPGSYKVFIRGGGPYAQGWWASGQLEALRSRAQTITVTAGATETIEATAQLAATIEGAVKTRAGIPVPTATVTPYVVNVGTGLWESMGGILAHGGTYSVTGLMPGTYRLLFDAWNPRYGEQYWDDKTSLLSADSIDLTEGQHVTGYDVFLSPAMDVMIVSIGGTSRIETAIKASQGVYFNPEQPARAVVITTGWNWPDALGASALAGVVNGPILLTSPAPSPMPPALDAEILRLRWTGATEAYILGDTNAVGTAVETRLRTIFGGETKVHRLGGYGRYATSLAIANALRAKEDTGWGGTVFLAKGTDYPDAMAAGPLAARQHWPVVLAESDGRGGLSARVKQFLSANATSKVIILGSTNAIPSSMASAAADAVGGLSKVERWEGPDRIATAIDIAEHSVMNGMIFDVIGIATAYNYPDALSAGPYLGRSGYPLLLTPNALPLRPALASKLTSLSPEVAAVAFFGGMPAIGQNVRDAIVDKLR